ncbi:MAG: response regulator [Xanthomarina gelatinilytica]|uniref:response regulator transcription factor n=1 Tax=Xanthomarina gelatinilytica TaxID=1137281 RepID=UPI003A8ACC95
MKQTIDILLIEDSKSYAQGMELLLKQHDKIDNVFYAPDYKTAMDVFKAETIDIVILDLNFETSDFDGFTIAKKIRQQYPGIKIIILSQHTRKQYHQELFDNNLADAYLDKQLGVKETYAALDAVSLGKKYVDNNILEMLEIETWMRVSKREREVIELLSQGLTQKEVADRLCISPKTIEVHTRNLFERFEVKNTTELAVKYIQYKNANREDVEDSKPPFQI